MLERLTQDFGGVVLFFEVFTFCETFNLIEEKNLSQGFTESENLTSL